ncbi:MAG: DUF1636 family protein [Pseudomonadota bacterium]
MSRAAIHLCSTCNPDRADADRCALQAAIDAAGLPADVREQACMNACAAPVSLALQGTGMATYFFCGIEPAQDRDDIVSTVRHFLQSPQGWFEDARPCGRLRHCLAGRVPALSSEA